MSKEKVPAFQFYPRDLLSDINYQMMTYPERGMYWHLVSLCWLEDSLPSDLGSLSRILQITPEALESAWRIIGKCFQVDLQDSARLRHQRLDLERQRQQLWKEKCAKGGRRSAHKRKTLNKKLREQSSDGLVEVYYQVNGNTSSSSSSAIEKKEQPSAVPKKKARVATGLPEDFQLSPEMRAWAAKSTPSVDVDFEFPNFMDYHCSKGDTSKDWNASLRTWLRNSQSRNGNDRIKSHAVIRQDGLFGRDSGSKAFLEDAKAREDD